MPCHRHGRFSLNGPKRTEVKLGESVRDGPQQRFDGDGRVRDVERRKRAQQAVFACREVADLLADVADQARDVGHLIVLVLSARDFEDGLVCCQSTPPVPAHKKEVTRMTITSVG